MRRSRTALQFSELRACEFILWVHLQRALERQARLSGPPQRLQACARKYETDGAGWWPGFGIQHSLIIIQPREPFVKSTRLYQSSDVFKGQRFVEIMF